MKINDINLNNSIFKHIDITKFKNKNGDLNIELIQKYASEIAIGLVSKLKELPMEKQQYYQTYMNEHSQKEVKEMIEKTYIAGITL